MTRIKNVFKFLKEYNEISNPVITEIREHKKWKMIISELPDIKELWSVYKNNDFEKLEIIKIKKPIIEPCPVPNEAIIQWLGSNWKNILFDFQKNDVKEKRLVETVNELGEIEKNEEQFSDDNDRIEKFTEWLKLRRDWQEKEMPKQRGLELYNNLFKLYADIKKESENIELILGDGHLRWRTENRVIDHPILLQKVQLVFNADIPEFTIKCDEFKADLYMAMLRVIPSINQTILSDVLKDVESGQYNIADYENNIALFQRLVNTIDENGIFKEKEEQKSTSYPVISIKPCLFLRKRTLGFANFINKIIEEIDFDKNLIFPDFFYNMVGIYKPVTDVKTEKEDWNQSGIDKNILLTLPANSEQLNIIKYLNHYGAVLVQGPPGTGKTHTIANLIGHLLSQGNSVLVTSHTEKALLVLKEKVYSELQSLCISLLSSSSQKKEIDTSLMEMARLGTSFEIRETEAEIRKLENERHDLIEKIKLLNKDLISIRSMEYQDFIYDNHSISPIETAKFIKSGEDNLNYDLGKTTDNKVGFPLELEKIEYIYLTNEKINKYEEEIIEKGLPSVDDIWHTKDFEKYCNSLKTIEKDLEKWNQNLKFKDGINQEHLAYILKKTINISNEIEKMGSYQVKIISKTINDKFYGRFWQKIIDDLAILTEKYSKVRQIQFENNYVIPKEIDITNSIKIIDEILSVDKELPINFWYGLIKPSWKKISTQITKGSQPLKKRSDFIKIKTVLDYRLHQKSLINKINKLIVEIDEAELFGESDFVEKTEKYIEKVKKALNWFELTWCSFTKEIGYFVEDESKFAEVCSIEFDNPINSIKNIVSNIIIPELQNTIKQMEYINIVKKADDYIQFLQQFSYNISLFGEFIEATKEKNVVLYKTKYDEIFEIANKKEIVLKRNTILEELKRWAPDWAKALKNRIGMHGESMLPKNIELAWKWHQLNNQFIYIEEINSNTIQRDILQINHKILDNAKKLAYKKAWYEKNKNKTAEQTQAIEGWSKTIKLIGKGTGKNAEMYRRKARELMPKCQTAIPAWIMPLNQVAEHFDPQKNKFDVVIIDEASQADILALTAIYLGKKIIIVGDDEQVSPDAIGVKIEDVNASIEQYLQEIPNNHLFNGKISVYDIAKASGFKQLMLTEHFRCLPNIIEFSNQLSYNGQIRTLRDSSNVLTKPAVVEYRVPGAVRDDNKVNQEEALHIASLICACIENNLYKGKTFGVISMLGSEQAYAIDKILQNKLDVKQYENRKIQCGNSAQFQGDERDIIFLSIVESPKNAGGPVRLVAEDGNNDMNRKRYNVAASRAKDQMWVVHSLNPEIDLKSDDIRLRLIKHAQNSVSETESVLAEAESEFEKLVLKDLINKGYQVIPQWKVGSYRIDIVVDDGIKRIAIECDGEKWHTQNELPNDLKRQAILERCGWKFIRIRGSAYYRNPMKTMAEVYNELEENGIKANYVDQKKEDDAVDFTIIEDIKRRAKDIRLEWSTKDENNELVNIPLEDGEFVKFHHEVKENLKPKTELKVQQNEKVIKQKKEVPVITKKKIDNLNTSLQSPKFDFAEKNENVKNTEKKVAKKTNIFPSASVEKVKNNKDIPLPKFNFTDTNI